MPSSPGSRRTRKQWTWVRQQWKLNYWPRLRPYTVWLMVALAALIISYQYKSKYVSILPATMGSFIVAHGAKLSGAQTSTGSNKLTPLSPRPQSNGDTPFISNSRPSHPPKACLAMIMKNEGPILPRLFESVKGFVSEYCIVDTGSTDDTIEVLKSMDMPGLLVEEPFVDFATTRNFLLDTCRERTTCDYLVLLDADMVLKFSPEWDWAKLDGKDVYNMIQVSSVEYENVRIIKRAADKIKVVGATHEYYDVPSEYSKGLLPRHLVYIDDVGDGKAKGDKFERDERLLRRELEKNPDNVRTVFYLANTLKDQGKYRDAIPLYERRVAMGGWFAEADYSLFMLSTCYLELDDLDNARKYAELAAFTRTARRAEPLYYLAYHLHHHGMYTMAWHYATLASTIPKPHVSEALFIAHDIYDYWVAYEQASLCPHVFPLERDFCLDKAEQFLGKPSVPEHLRELVENKMAVYLDAAQARL